MLILSSVCALRDLVRARPQSAECFFLKEILHLRQKTDNEKEAIRPCFVAKETHDELLSCPMPEQMAGIEQGMPFVKNGLDSDYTKIHRQNHMN